MQDYRVIQGPLIATIIFSVILQANAYSYKDAKNWGEKYGKCYGKHQSPVIMNAVDIMKYESIYKQLKLTNFEKSPTNMTMKNTGHTVEVTANWSGEPPKISDGPLNGSYVFEKATFHWAQKSWIEGIDPSNLDNSSTIPSPYTIDMEMHLYFYRTDLKSFKKAKSEKNGLAAFRLWLQTGYVRYEHFFDNLEKNLYKVRSPKSAAKIPPICFTKTLINRMSPFVFYEGSLDHPPCTESVTWFTDDIGISVNKKLVEEFRKIKLSDGDVSNVRPPQAMNDRKPKTSYCYDG